MASLPFPKTWWKEAVVYQIYPASFLDSNGDGIGDLNGIFSKLDYLKDLGVNVLWLSPIYKSPLADMGYDISDYQDIDPRYGTLEDWDNLLAGVHARGMKLIMDLVVNHSSDEHSWFVQSRSSKSDPKRDWYIWRPPKYDSEGRRQEPNNWRSVFQGSAWDYDEGTDEYYLHLYVSKQPDFNWDNPEVRDAAWDLMKFWLDRGCDGFRMDVINLISKVEGLPDAPIIEPGEKYQLGSQYFANGPRVHEYIREMREKVLSRYDLLTVGETPFTHDTAELDPYVIPPGEELNMVFQFELMDLDHPKGEHTPLVYRPWKVKEFKEVINRWQTYKRDEGYWNAVFTENHDHPRAVSRFGDDSDKWRAVSAKMLAISQVMQSGTQYVFQGQELGLKNFPRSWGIEEYKDVASQNYYNRIREHRQRESGKEDVDMEDVLDGFQKKARDHSRTPMQWDSTEHSGFTSGTPWMRVNDDYATCNAANQVDDDDSVLAFWKAALKFRKDNDFLIYGDFTDISTDHDQVFAYLRNLQNQSALVVLNFKEKEVEYSLDPARNWSGFVFAFGNYKEVDDDGIRELGGAVKLKSFEGRVYLRK
ncbi:glycoside hydrolase family 13 protein [Pluteus cervinus]|uniref:Glycoside hydrolase family 13 protein n=1 Tax=Pluteus cervinus TaxID=181527 RepID=A0ACD3AM32_9AGAR|nr:glycoside hydrolase family 13 protein [Pluteus cervinus]